MNYLYLPFRFLYPIFCSLYFYEPTDWVRRWYLERVRQMLNLHRFHVHPFLFLSLFTGSCSLHPVDLQSFTGLFGLYKVFLFFDLGTSNPVWTFYWSGVVILYVCVSCYMLFYKGSVSEVTERVVLKYLICMVFLIYEFSKCKGLLGASQGSPLITSLTFPSILRGRFI